MFEKSKIFQTRRLCLDSSGGTPQGASTNRRTDAAEGSLASILGTNFLHRKGLIVIC